MTRTGYNLFCFVYLSTMLYFIALLEGFTTLAVQMIALRIATPIVGSSIILTSVFIGIILLAISAGYFVGGILASKVAPSKLRPLLACFLTFSGLYYGFITFATQEAVLEWSLLTTGNYIVTLFFVAIVLFFLPVFVDAQTLPILTELVPEQSKGKAAGSMLFASTIGSFLGSVGTSIRLFEGIGVRMTAILTCSILFVCVVLLLRNNHRKRAWIMTGFLAVFIWIAVNLYYQPLTKISGLLYYHDSAYQEIMVREHVWHDGQPTRIFHTNRSFASGIYTNKQGSPFDYMQEMMQITDTLKPQSILVIGTAGFTYPHLLSQLPYVTQIDAVDIDPSVKAIAEQYFLEEPLSSKVTFYPLSARYVINQSVQAGKRYDLILLDAYNGKTLPDELTTREFFSGIKQLAPVEGIFANFILDSTLSSALSKNLLSTWQQVFGETWTKNVTNNPQQTFDNFIVSAKKPTPDYTVFDKPGILYTDDRRTTETDLVTMWRGGR